MDKCSDLHDEPEGALFFLHSFDVYMDCVTFYGLYACLVYNIIILVLVSLFVINQTSMINYFKEGVIFSKNRPYNTYAGFMKHIFG